MDTSRTNAANFRCLYIVLITLKRKKHKETLKYKLSKVCFSLQETATPITSGKWEVIYISKVTKDSMCV